MSRVSGGFVLGAILGVMACLVFGLTLVWLNIERMDMAYGLKKLQTEIDHRESLLAKLEVERDNLLAPHRLRRLAQEYGLAAAETGQVRRIVPSGTENDPSTGGGALPLPGPGTDN